MLECVVNLSEGRRLELVAELAMLAGNDLLDVHSDPHHHRSVFTLVGTNAVRTVARHAVEVLDLGDHQGVHPRLGCVDVVPFVPLEDSTMDEAIAERDAFARWAADELGVPCFLYGPRIAGAGGAPVDRTLPELRRLAWAGLPPDVGPTAPHHRAGAMCVGARPVLVAYNVWLAAGDLATARRIAQAVRSPEVRALALPVGARLQVSMNLVDPERVGPADAYDRVTEQATAHGMDVVGAELVGLVPARALARIPKHRWSELDLASERTIEWQLAARNRRR
jgi:glutamate formiminotransferase / 5-formyltetrahydrofolate cyclo-ligase